MQIKQLAIVLLALSTTACGRLEFHIEDLNPDVKPKVAIKYSQPNGSPQCGCTGARAVSLQNLDDKHTRIAKYRIRSTNLTDGERLPEEVEEVTLPKGKTEFVGCTLGQPAALNTCKLKHEYKLLDERASKSTSNVATTALRSFGPVYSPSVQSCELICQNLGDQSCFRFGRGAAPAFVPIIAMVDRLGSGDGVVNKADIARAYNLDPTKDSCGRGNLEIQGDRMTNTSSERGYCAVDIYSVGSAQDVPNIVIYAPIELVGFRSRVSNYPLLAGRLVGALEFRDIDQAASVGFVRPNGSRSPQTGPQLDPAATELWGGTVTSAGRMRDGRLVIATSNGCLSVRTR